jgi:Tfp pilus assembly protein PilV
MMTSSASPHPIAQTPRRRRPRRGEAGFTLVELMYATGYFMIGLVGVVSFQLVAASGAGRAADVSMATNLCTSNLEMMRVTPINTLMSQASVQLVFDRFGTKQGSTGFTSAYFTVTETVSQPQSAQYIDATVNTSWQTSGSTFTHNIQMQTRLPTE